MTATRTPAQVLQEARRRDSREKRSRVVAVVDKMLNQGDEITFANVAKTAKVSTWLVYASGVREHIDKARRQQATRPARDQDHGLTAGAASLRTDLELSRADNARLRGEIDQMRASMRRQLGQQLEGVDAVGLHARVQELTSEKQDLGTQLQEVRVERDALARKLEETGEDLIAARASLRRMIRNEN
ncbi:DUF6262 family protein [Streptomyces sp. NPDC051572]|uniref:DUF6262 family protein n=1 Tax=unclassified Streptomyces TaxID=2593676 RepID=UPI0032452B41